VRDGHPSDSTETPIAMAACVALGLDGVRGIVADSQAYGKRTLGLCLEQGVGRVPLVPRTCALRPEVEAWGQQHGALPFVRDKPGRTRQEPPRRWHGRSVVRRVEVAYADGRLEMAERRLLGGHASQLAHQAAGTDAAAQAKEATRVAEHLARGEARWFAWAADAEAAIAEYAGRGQGRRGRKPRPWRDHALHSQGEAGTQRQKRPQRGRPPKTALPQDRLRYRLRGEAQAPVPSTDTQGWTVLVTTVGAESGTDTELLQAYQEQPIPVEPGLRWIKTPAAISPGWLEKPERMAAVAMRTVVGLRVYAVIQRQVRLSLHAHAQQVPGNKGPTATPTAAVVFDLFAPVMLGQFVMDNATTLQGHGIQAHHLLICEAVGIDPAWYQGGAPEQNALPRTTPP
jgi:hypothetical protein